MVIGFGSAAGTNGSAILNPYDGWAEILLTSGWEGRSGQVGRPGFLRRRRIDARWLRFRRVGGRRLPAIGQPIAKNLRVGFGVVGQAFQEVAEIREHIHLMAVTTRCHTKQKGRGLGPRGASREHPIFSADGNVAKRALGDVVVDRQKPVVQKARERGPVPKRVGDRLADQTLGQHLAFLRLQPLT